MAPSAVDAPNVQAKDLKAPQSSMPPTDKLNTKRKIVCFSDFDGTIFMQDTGHILFNKFGCGSEQREILDKQIKSGERSFRDVSEEMWGSLNVPFADGFNEMKGALEIDPQFQNFHQFCVKNDIPFNVISAGLRPVLRSVLDHFLGEEASSGIDIIANDAVINDEGTNWQVVWRHDTPHGHDKALSINEYKEAAKIEAEDGQIPMVVMIGDGVSDLPAARSADLLFARRGLALEEYCIEHKIAYIPYDTFGDIQKEIIKIAKVDDEKTKGKGLPINFNPRANLWRRASSKNAVSTFAAMTPKTERAFIWPETFTEIKEHNENLKATA